MKQSAWEEFYAFQIKDGESISLQIEKLECICKKLSDVNENLSDKAVESKLLSSLPLRFSSFRMAWECTPKAERKKENLISRLLREDKRLTGVEDSVSTLALQVNSLKFKETLNSKSTKKEENKKQALSKNKKIEALKKRTKCAYCEEKGHWVRECPKAANDKKENSNDSKMTTAYITETIALYSENSEKNDDFWIADTGASRHMTYRKDFFTHFEPVKEKHFVVIADDKVLTTQGAGTVLIQEEINGKTIERELRDVLFVPELRRNLFSIGTVNKKKFSFHSFEHKCEIRDSDGQLSSLVVC